MSKADGEVWQCRIGPVPKELLPRGADSPMRNAVEAALLSMVPSLAPSDIAVFSGWGEKFDESERAVIENRQPDSDKVVTSIVLGLVAVGLERLVLASLIDHVSGDGAVTVRALLRDIAFNQ